MPLFKYVTPDRLDVIQNCAIRFTPLNGMNDPFEGLCDTSMATRPEFVKNVKEPTVQSFVLYETFAAIAEARKERFSIPQVGQLFDVAYLNQVPKIKTEGMNILRDMAGKFRVLSLSRVGPWETSSLLLWGHYTDGHRGMVFEFDDKHPWIAKHVFDERQSVDGSDVTYCAKRPEWGTHTYAREYYLSKSEHWIYEKEYRLVKPREAEDLDLSRCDSLASWPPELLLGVTIGANASQHTVEGAQAALAARPEFVNVKLTKAKVHLDEYRLEPTPLAF